MKDLNLPDPIAAYFKGDRHDAAAVARCFNTDAVVIDEKRTHTGQAAIEAWKAEASAQFSYTVEPHSLERKDRTYIVTSRVAGNFPGSPVDLRYFFTFRRGRISTLEIKP